MAIDPKLRGMVGQRKALEEITTICESARGRGLPVRHLAFVGPGGCGKTELANRIADIMDAPFDETMAGAVKSKDAMTDWILGFKPHTIAFCDEVQDVSVSTREQILYPALGRRPFIMVKSKEGMERRNLPPFTLIVATTEGGFNPSMARRFKTISLGYFTVDELTEIITLTVKSDDYEGFQIQPDAARYLAVRSLGVAGTAQQRLADALDHAVRDDSQVITLAHAVKAMDMAGIDDMGLGQRERTVLIAVAREGGRPIGLESIAGLTGFRDIAEEVATLTRLDLLRLNAGQRGRVATVKAYEQALGMDAPPMVLGREGNTPR
jgi:Holliday junction DNA helicase RuvB